MPGETFALERFVQAQDGVYLQACAELAAGRKRGHWMWFVFPQLVQLGHSPTARHFGILGRDEACAYWRHPLLGSRLRHSAELMLGLRGCSARQVLGTPDDLKLRSCMTLFEVVAATEPAFAAVLAAYFEGQRDPATLSLLGPSGAR